MTQIERLHRDGILRRGSSRAGFRYVHARDGRSANGALQRIRQLRLPPAWRHVAISASPHARVQAVGRDAAGRWQYVYHPAHVRARELGKQRRLVQFGAALPALRRAVARDLRRRDLSRDRVLAAVARVLSLAFIRPGSEVYAAENGSYGIATLRRKHVRVAGTWIYLDFPGKSGQRQQRTLRDPAVARLIRRLLQLPGYEIFKYADEAGRLIDVKRRDINEYIKRHMGESFSAKDFRTWAGTLICACSLARAAAREAIGGSRRYRHIIAAALRETAQQLGNTPAVCRASYVTPCVLSAFERGQVVDRYLATTAELLARQLRGLHPAEHAVLRLLMHHGRATSTAMRQRAVT
jgi:DNA topoisomerase-1